jgi:benzoate membrane transport protein
MRFEDHHAHGVATLVPRFGAFALNLLAITAAICMGREAHEDPARRYVAAVSCGLIYAVIGLFGAAVTGVLTAFPRELVVAIAGLALLGSIGGGLAVALKDEAHREAALITFLVTLSGSRSGDARPSGAWRIGAFVQQWRPRRARA